jgi:surfactin synthase thioesterase subunit
MIRLENDISSTSTAWLLDMAPRKCAAIRLICIPQAGAGPLTFRSWYAYLPQEIEMCGVRLPGREMRLREPPIVDLNALLPQIARALKAKMTGPYALFGHSMGAVIAYEMARYLFASEKRGPEHLFVSGHGAPHLPRDFESLSGLSDAELIDKMRELGGSPPEVLAHPELMQLLLPVLRSDFTICENYRYVPGPPLPCPITALGGLKDRWVTREAIEAWRVHTRSAFSARMLFGDHFFHLSHAPAVVRVLAEELGPLLN